MSRDLLAGSRQVRYATWRLLRVLARDLWADGARLLGHTVGDMMWFLDGRGRRVVDGNLLPLVPGRDARGRAVRACYRACAEGVAFTLRLDRLRPPDLPRLEIVDPHGVLPLRGPAVLATLHADWDALLGAIALHGLVEDLRVVALPAGDGRIDELIAGLRATTGALPLPWIGAARAALRHLRDGGVVGVLADRDYTGAARPVRVGDRTLRIPTGPVELARRVGCAVVPAACLRQRGRTLLVVGMPIDARLIGTDAAVRDLARFQLRVLSASPGRWVAFHPVWSQRYWKDQA